jgi:FkbM family methyltransferase
MQANSLAIKIGNFLYHGFFPVYSRVYPAFKKRQDAVEIAWMRRLVRRGSKVLDIGANIGFYTVLLSDLVGEEGRVHAFEPEPVNFKHLSTRAGNRKNVVLVPSAVSDRQGKLVVYTSPKLNVDHRTYRVSDYDQAIQVEALRIDDYVGGQFAVDFVKMDIQGYEFSALRGMEQTIAANPTIVIFSEFWPYGLRQAGASAIDVFDYIRSLDLNVWIPERHCLRPMNRASVEKLTEAETVYYNVLLSKRPIT